MGLDYTTISSLSSSTYQLHSWTLMYHQRILITELTSSCASDSLLQNQGNQRRDHFQLMLRFRILGTMYFTPMYDLRVSEHEAL